ncbi:MAG: hypothetical protein E7B11_02490 [Clostridiales bacterium]|nr:hypothetical protein [Clostridiales bacterium]MDU3239421.1 hypothetical protein [Clostridiales bacterium]
MLDVKVILFIKVLSKTTIVGYSVYGSLVSIIQGNFKLDCISMIDLEGEVKFFYDRNMASQNLKTVREEGWFQAAIVAESTDNYWKMVSILYTIF